MGVAHAAGDLHPWLCLIVNVDSGCISLVAGIVYDSSVVEIAYASVIVQPVLRSAYGQIVFLTERIAECKSIPVVRYVIVLAVGVSQYSRRIHFEVFTYELFACRDRIYLISESSVVLVEEVGVCICICFGWTFTRIYLRIVHHPIVCLIVEGRIGNDVILRYEP